MNHPFKAVCVSIGLLGLVLLPSCSRTPATAVRARDLALGKQLYSSAGVRVFERVGQRDQVAVQYGLVAVRSLSSGQVEFLDYQEAERRLGDDDRVRFVDLWRVLPASGWEDAIQARRPTPAEIASRYADLSPEAEDPPPSQDPPLRRSCGCPCSCPGLSQCSTWGCLKCCYR